MFTKIKEQYERMPVIAKQLLKRELLLITGWMLLYHLLLQPYRIPDQWLAHITAKATSALITAWYQQPTYLLDKPAGTAIFTEGHKWVNIAYSCDALELYLIYGGFVVCIPNMIKRKFLFIAGGIAFIFLLNVLRCFILTFLSNKNSVWFGFAHHYAFNLVVYAFIFGAWFLYLRNYIKPKPHDY